MTHRRLLIVNAVANVVRIASAGGIQIIVPLALAQLLPIQIYTPWALVYALAAYVTYFDVGIPTSLQVFVAKADVEKDWVGLKTSLKAAVRLTGGVCMLLLVGGGVLAVFLRSIVPSLPAAVATQTSISLLILLVGQLAALMTVTLSAYFAGLQQSVTPARIVTAFQVASLAATLTIATVTSDLPLIATGYAIPLLGASGTLYLRCRRDLDQRQRRTASFATIEPHVVSPRNLLSRSGPLIIWSVTSLLALQSGSAIVGHFAYHDVVAFTYASVLSTGISGLVGALATPLLPAFVKAASSSGDRMARSVITATRVHSAALYSVAAWVTAAVPVYLSVLLPGAGSVSSRYWVSAIVLLAGTVIHLAGTPPTLALVATNRHRRITVPPVFQAILSVGLSVWLAAGLGAIGAAIALAIAATVAAIGFAPWVVRLGGLEGLRASELITWTSVAPAVGLAPAIAAVTVAYLTGSATRPVAIILLIAAATVGTVYEITLVLPAGDRRALRSMIAQRLGRPAAAGGPEVDR